MSTHVPALLGLILLIAAATSSASAAGFFVARNGDDAWSGKLAQPNATKTDGPFATIDRARQAVRVLKTRDPAAALTVTIRGGTYYLQAPLALTPEDSGAPDRPVRYQAYPGEKVVLSGGRPITSSWQKGEGHIYTTHIPAVASGNWYFRLLRVGDDWGIRARYPNFDPAHPYTGGWLFVKRSSHLRGAYGAAVGSIHNRGDFLEWQVEIPATGDYNVFHYYAAENKPFGRTDMGGRTVFTVDGGKPVKLMNFQDTGSFRTFRWSARNAVLHLTAGTHTIRWTNIEGGGLNYDAFVLCDDPAWKPHGVPPAPPAAGKHLVTVQAETFSKSHGKEMTVQLPASRREFGFDPHQLKHWAHPEQIEMHVFPAWGWVNSIEPIAKLDFKRGIGEIAGREAAQELRVGNRYFLENIREELDSPGEWYLDRTTGTLSYWPTHADFASREIVAPVHDRIIELKGTPDNPVHDVQFSGLTFMDTSYTPRIDNPYYPPDAAIWLIDARDCLIENCRFTRLGGSALNMVDEAVGNKFLGNTVENVGENGVFMQGQGKHFPHGNIVAGCHMDHLGLIYKHVGGVYIGPRDPSLANAPGNLIAHNLITDVPRYGISLKMNQGNNVVEYNEIRRSNLETNDTGGIESCVRNEHAAGNTYRYNLVVDTIGLKTTPDGQILTPFYTWGIYMDDHSSNALIYGNICVRNVRGGIHIHGGRDNVIENNILVDSAEQQIEFNNIGTQMVGNIFRHNILYRLQPGGNMIRSGGWTDKVLAACDDNVYWQAGQHPALGFLGKSFADWRKLGYDAHSVVADPLFVDPAHDDYRLQPDSPALKLGFKPIPVDQIGLRGYHRSDYE